MPRKNRDKAVMVKIGYTDLTIYHECPRRFAFTKMGYRPIETPAPMLAGELAHTGIFAHFRNTDWQEAMRQAYYIHSKRLNHITDAKTQNDAQKRTYEAHKRAVELATRYIQSWAQDYTATLVEPQLEQPEASIIAHPDLLCYFKDKRIIADFKTSHSPDVRYYDMSGQTDFYAFFLQLLGDEIPIDLISYDCISDEGIFRHMRPPRLDAGERIYRQLCNLSDEVNSEGLDEMLEPRIRYSCPNSCSYFEACWLLETSDMLACSEYLDRNMVQENWLEGKTL